MACLNGAARTAEDNATTTVQTEFEVEASGNVTDNRTIRTETTVRVREEGEGDDGDFVDYEQQVRSVLLDERVQFGGQDLEAAIGDCGLGGEEEGVEAAGE